MHEFCKKRILTTASNRKGVTFLELMVVIAIIGILAAIATPVSIRLMTNRKLSNGSREVLSAMQFARFKAVKERANVVVSFNIANDSYVAFVNADNDAGQIQAASDPTIKSGTLETVDISAANFNGNSALNFDPRGFSESGSVTLQDGNGNSRQIVVTATGNCQIQ